MGYRGGIRISTMIGGRWGSFSGVTVETSPAACEAVNSAMVVSDNVIGISSVMVLDRSLFPDGCSWSSES